MEHYDIRKPLQNVGRKKPLKRISFIDCLQYVERESL